MYRYFRKLHEHRSPPGLERTIWRKLPLAAAACVLLPAVMSFLARLFPPGGNVHDAARTLTTIDIFAVATGVTGLVAVLTVAIGCIVVMIMKGPAYVADGYDRLHRPDPLG